MTMSPEAKCNNIFFFMAEYKAASATTATKVTTATSTATSARAAAMASAKKCAVFVPRGRFEGSS